MQKLANKTPGFMPRPITPAMESSVGLSGNMIGHSYNPRSLVGAGTRARKYLTKSRQLEQGALQRAEKQDRMEWVRQQQQSDWTMDDTGPQNIQNIIPNILRQLRLSGPGGYAGPRIPLPVKQ
jgi:hypothetical protein